MVDGEGENQTDLEDAAIYFDDLAALDESLHQLYALPDLKPATTVSRS